MSFLKRILPKNVSGQLMLLVTISLIVAQTINLYILIGENRLRARSQLIETVVANIVSHVQHLPDVSNEQLTYELRGHEYRNGRFFLSATSATSKIAEEFFLYDYNQEVASMLSSQQFAYQAFELASRPHFKRNNDFNLRKNTIRKRPPRHLQNSSIGHFPPPRIDNDKDKLSNEIVLSIQLQSGIWFNGVVPHSSIEPLTPRILFSTFALLSITLLGLAFFMRRITRPLSNFANAADEFGRGNSPAELSESGPQDIRKAAQAFNRMQRRLSRMLDTQRIMLRAVGHDLRTPLTSLRIRSEMIPAEFQQQKIIATIDEMTAMTEDILSWTKNASGLEEVGMVDLYSLLSSMVDDYTDQGQKITLNCPDNVILKVRHLSLKRALSNVINNAFQYGRSAQVQVVETTNSVLIQIDDEGPGIDENLFSDALKPFVRLESSRNKKTGGSGLGLSISETIIQAEGGKLLLENLPVKGLRVTLSLPR